MTQPFSEIDTIIQNILAQAGMSQTLLLIVGAIIALTLACRAGLKRTYHPRHSLPDAFEIFDPFVIDGDTLAKGDLRIRLWGIDAPEKGQRQGQVSRRHMVGMTSGRTLTIHPRDIDQYGRLVAQVFDGEQDLGLKMVEDGFAVASTSFTRTYAKPQRRARRNRTGLWRYGAIQDPTRYRRTHG